MISTADFKPGITIEMDNELYRLVEFLHVKPGKGGAFVRTKLKKISDGRVLEKTFRAGEKVKQAIVAAKKMQFLYQSGEQYCFMDSETYEQIMVDGSVIGDEKLYLKENEEVKVLFYGDTIIGLEIPNFVELEVKKTVPGVKGDTATGGSKTATLETGLVVTVPLFINEGDRVKIDTRTGLYVERC